jgi:hypothetical protein
MGRTTVQGWGERVTKTLISTNGCGGMSLWSQDVLKLRCGTSRFQASWAKNLCEIPFQWKKTGSGGTWLSSQLWQEASTRTVVQTSLDKKWDPTSKITRAKRAGWRHGLLGSKHEALSSNPSTTTKKPPKSHKNPHITQIIIEECSDNPTDGKS